jgi:hypothetical protein
VKQRAESRGAGEGGDSTGGGASQGRQGSEGIAQFLAELIDLGFEHRLQQLYRRFEEGEISLGFLAQELGLGVRDLYAALERRGLPTTNIGARTSTTGE